MRAFCMLNWNYRLILSLSKDEALAGCGERGMG